MKTVRLPKTGAIMEWGDDGCVRLWDHGAPAIWVCGGWMSGSNCPRREATEEATDLLRKEDTCDE